VTKLLVDIQALQSPHTRRRGIGRYTRNLITALAAARPGWRIALVSSEHLESADLTGLPDLPQNAFQPPLPVCREHVEANERCFAEWLAGLDANALLIASFFDDQVLVPRFTGARPTVAAILYDLIPLLFPQEYLRRPDDLAGYASRFRRLLQTDAVLCISEASARDLRTLAAGQTPKLVSIGGAPDACFRPCSVTELESYRSRFRAQWGLRREFLLYVGGFDFRKNLRGALEAFAALPEGIRREFDLVITCQLTAEQRDCLERWGHELGIAEAMRLTGFVTDDELRALYGLCRLFLFPSLYEGLGLPVLEALRCGAPVVASNRSSVPEAAGPHSRLTDPTALLDMAGAIAAALAEPRDLGRAARMDFASGFTWERTAEAACQALEAPPPPRPSSRRRRRLAWVSPLPPAASGIADYSAELLEHLGSLFEIELVVNPAEPSVSRALARRHLVLGADEVAGRHEAEPFDFFIYHLGNSHHHLYMLDLMRRFRGLIVLHDFYLGGLVQLAIRAGVWRTTLADEVQREGEVRLAKLLRAGKVAEERILDEVPLNRRILESAEAVIVHSAWAWQRVRPLARVPVTRVPLVAPVPRLGAREDERRRLGLPLDAFLIATLGLVNPAKRLPALLRAVAALPPLIRQESRVLIVGFAAPERQAELRSLAESLGIGSMIHFVGRVSLEDFAGYARAADVCVQLRYPTRGETSAALYRALGAGAACVISNHGAMAEIPDEVAMKVRTPEHEVEDLTAALQRLYQQAELRAALGEAAVRYIAENHDVAAVVRQYAAMIERATARDTACLPSGRGELCATR
jgi:glycosyltransferase involved in cell wall biosynthesis